MIQEARKIIVEAKEMLLYTSEMPEAFYNELLFELATEWAEAHTQCEDAALYLLKQPEFWGWWKKVWAERTEAFNHCIHYDEDGEWYLNVIYKGERQFITDRLNVAMQYVHYMRECMLSDEGRAIMDLHFSGFLKGINSP